MGATGSLSDDFASIQSFVPENIRMEIVAAFFAAFFFSHVGLRILVLWLYVGNLCRARIAFVRRLETHFHSVSA